jgi:hypothetical protein
MFYIINANFIEIMNCLILSKKNLILIEKSNVEINLYLFNNSI